MDQPRLSQFFLSVFTLLLAAFSVSCAPGGHGERGFARTGDPNDPIFSNPGGNPRKGTPTPIVINAVVPTSDGTVGAPWSRAVAWRLDDDDSADGAACYRVDFHFYRLDPNTHAIKLADNLFVATPAASTECRDQKAHHVGEQFVVTLARKRGSIAPAAGGTYLLVGTCNDPTAADPLAANKGSGAYLFQFRSK